jgi:hypothetical protein
MSRNAPSLAAAVGTTLGILGLMAGTPATRGVGIDPKVPPKLTPVVLKDYEPGTTPPTVWVVNIPDENAAVKLSTDHPHEGKQSLKLHYRFVAKGEFQYLGVPNKVRVRAPVHKLRYMLYGDGSKCSYGVQVTDAGGETHQYSANTGRGGVIDFKGWNPVVIDLDARHETWGGDKNGKLDYPLTAVTFTVGQPRDGDKRLAAEGDLYFDALSADSEGDADETLGGQIAITEPEYCASIKGDTRVAVAAPGFKAVTVKCWKQGEGQGADATVAEVKLDARGRGAFTFPADDYPHGPVVLRLSGDGRFARDNCYLQLYNRGGVSWNEGIPKDPPPAAKGLKLLFADDFKGPLSISGTDPKATYYEHKPPSGFQDFSAHPFSNFDSPKNPFAQVDTYLRIRASDARNSAGLISSLKNDGSGLKAAAPCYFECRFLGPNAVGAWPGFWLMTDYMTGYDKLKEKTPCDELDVIEAYGGEGPGSPNAFDAYMVTPHCWNQGDDGKKLEDAAFKAMKNPVRMKKFGIKSTWYEAFHTYGCKVTETDTVYYCDDVEVGRHATFPLSKKQPLFFMVNLATGGGWPVDLSRYGGRADMYVDYIRVYGNAP